VPLSAYPPNDYLIELTSDEGARVLTAIRIG
jgi:hypothetical protein